MLKVNLGPGNAIVENGLPAAGKEFAALFLTDAEFHRQGLACLAQEVFAAVISEPQQRQHEGLKVRNGHITLLIAMQSATR